MNEKVTISEHYDGTSGKKVMKRVIDVVVSGTALFFLWPLMILIAVAIKLESKGPILYGALRAGKGYQLFPLLKFRTMSVGADQAVKSMQHLNLYAGEAVAESVSDKCSNCDAGGCTMLVDNEGKLVCENVIKERSRNKSAFFKFKDDPRITRVGKFLRNTSLDELPQLINVLRGDMSLVGNRPLPLYEAEQLTTDEAALRFMAPAGITGLWQVTKRGKKGDMSEAERIELDKAYAANHSLKTDIKLIFKTFPALFQKDNV